MVIDETILKTELEVEKVPMEEVFTTAQNLRMGEGL